MSKIYLVRHAKAGSRRLWTADDIDRPLSPKGSTQSDKLSKRLAKHKPELLYSSPYLRCMQTLEPLAKRLGTEIETDQRLSEGEQLEPLLELLSEVPDHTVLCGHGDLIPEAVLALKERGATLRTPPNWGKASVWELQRNKKGAFVAATVWPPPGD